MTNELNVRPEVLGPKLRQARTLNRITQEVAATKLGLSRTTLVAIESAKRTVSKSELRMFAELYDIPESELLNEDSSPLELDVQFRSGISVAASDEEVAVAGMLNRLANSTLQIEALLKQSVPRIDLPAVVVTKTGSLEHQAEDAALNLRSRLGIGLGPIQNLAALMEFEMGLRVFERRLPSRISGAVAFNEKVGGFVLLNSSHPLQRRRVSGGHEVGHIITRQNGICVLFENEEPQRRGERFCDLFGIAFLTPATAVRRKARELKELFGGFSLRQLLMMAIFFNVSIEAMTRRMESLELLPRGTFDDLRSQRIGTEHRRKVAEEMSVAEEGPTFTPRSLLMAGVAYDRELLSEQQIASMLELSLVEVRCAIQERNSDVGEIALDLAE